MGGISLTASMRSNLLSLQNISGQVSSTQNKLATGNKVNSAIDNPSSYYTALSLNNRADDLNALLDSMGQAISTIKAATTALESAADFLEQASAVATQALETAKVPAKSFFEEKVSVAAVVSTWDELKAALDSGKQGNIVIYGNIEAQDAITLQAGQNLVGVGFYGVDEPDVDKFSQLSFDMSKLNIANAITGSQDNVLISDLSIKAKIADAKILSANVIYFKDTQHNKINNLDLVMDLKDRPEHTIQTPYGTRGITGGSIIITGINNIVDINNKQRKLVTSAICQSQILLKGTLNLDISSQEGRGIIFGNLETVETAELNIINCWRGIDSTNTNFRDNSKISIKGQLAIVYGTCNIYDNIEFNSQCTSGAFMALTNNPLTVNLLSTSAKLNINGNFSDNPNQELTFNAIAGSKINYNGKVYENKQAINDNTMDNANLPKGFDLRAEGAGVLIPSLDWLTEQNTNRSLDYDYENETKKDSDNYQEIINQYDALIKDASYKGINLLQTDKLSVKFNEDNTASLNVEGKDMSSQALGFTVFDWQTQGDIADSLAEIASALKSIRNYSSELGNNYSIITTRQDFTNSLINVLTEGADKLTLADMNEESANMLALQTRQQLAINSLSLASQASQSILKLF